MTERVRSVLSTSHVVVRDELLPFNSRAYSCIHYLLCLGPKRWQLRFCLSRSVHSVALCDPEEFSRVPVDEEEEATNAPEAVNAKQLEVIVLRTFDVQFLSVEFDEILQAHDAVGRLLIVLLAHLVTHFREPLIHKLPIVFSRRSCDQLLPQDV